MRGCVRLSFGLLLLTVACGAPQGVGVPQHEGARKSAAVDRAARRLYDGAPPVIAHEPFGIECVQCHNRDGMDVGGVGFAPPSPHEATPGVGEAARCVQCHVFALTEDLFVENDFVGMPQDLRAGRRLHANAPPNIPHRLFMRENCVACHSGPAAREPIRTPHPERARCTQCHVPVTTTDEFERPQEERS